MTIDNKTANPGAPDTIVLVHGLWVTPRSWEHWIARYQARGYRVLAPAYPGFEVEVEALNADPSPVEALTIPKIIERFARGAFTQIMLDHGYGAAGVAINSAPTEGVLVAPLTQLKSTTPAFSS